MPANMRLKKPLITIAVPSYNHELYVATAISSLFRQSFRDFEIIIIDDGSTDNSWIVIENELKRNPGIVVNHFKHENRGLSATLNRAISLANGKYFGFLPSDDFFHPRKLERQAETLENHPGIAVCYTWQNIVDAAGNSTDDNNIKDWFDLNYVSSYSFFPHLLERNFLAAPSALVVTDDLIKVGGFDENLIYAQDHDLWLRLLGNKEGFILHERLIYYRWHGENLTFKETSETRDEKRYILKKFVNALQPNSKRVLENGEAMRRHIAASCVDDVEELIAVFDRNTRPSRQNIQNGDDNDQPVCADGAALRHIEFAEDRIFELRNEREWINNERIRICKENEELKTKLSEHHYNREKLETLLANIHSVRMSRGWKVLRLLQILKAGLATANVSRWLCLAKWINERLLGKRQVFELRPDPLELVEEVNIVTGQVSHGELTTDMPCRQDFLDFYDTNLDQYFPDDEENVPLVSVLIPVYNHAHMLATAIESVLAQDYPNLEIVILDDGSTDAIEKVMNNYALIPCVRMYRQPNRGLPKALTTLHSLAKGQFLTWTSADNVLEPFMISTLAKVLIAHPEAVMTFGDVSLIDETGAPYGKKDYRPHNIDPQRPDILRLNRIADYLEEEPDNYINAAFLYRKSASQVLRGFYDHRLPGLEDFDFWLRMKRAGSIIHAGNEEPIYKYRVHEDTLSRRLVNDQAEAHYERTQRLMEIELRRKKIAGARWSVCAHPAISPADREEFSMACGKLPVNWVEKSIDSPFKLLTIAPEGYEISKQKVAYQATLYLTDEEMKPAFNDSSGKNTPEIKLPRGVSIPVLAKKAREWKCPEDDVFVRKAKGRPVVGFHVPSRGYDIDDSRVLNFMSKRKDLFFVFVDSPDSGLTDRLARITDKVENAGFAGVESFGKAYRYYAAWNVLWAPPLASRRSLTGPQYFQCAALSYSIGVWFLFSGPEESLEWIPFSSNWDIEPHGVESFFQLIHNKPDHDIQDRYLAQWTPEGRLTKVLALADAALQDKVVGPLCRLDEMHGEETKQKNLNPVPTSRHEKGEDRSIGPIILQLEELGHGGLERVVAYLAKQLQTRTGKVHIVCTKKHGPCAAELEAFGIPVFCCEENIAGYTSILNDIRPAVLNTHYSPFGLTKASSLGIPIVATVHNTYAWYDESDWENEKKCYQNVDAFIAVSSFVGEYYLSRMGDVVVPGKMTVVPNCLNADLADKGNRNKIRESLGIDKDDFVLLNLATYDPRKNQLGLLTAFNEAFSEDRSLRLICAGHIASRQYFDLIAGVRDDNPTKARIEIRGLEDDVSPLLAAADAFVISSYFEGWSLAATEALQFGLPLIHTMCGSAIELCGKRGERGFIIDNPGGDPYALNKTILYQHMFDHNPPNTQQMARAMINLASDRTRWRSRNSSIARYCKRTFSVDAFISGYMNVFKKMIAQNKAV